MAWETKIFIEIKNDDYEGLFVSESHKSTYGGVLDDLLEALIEIDDTTELGIYSGEVEITIKRYFNSKCVKNYKGVYIKGLENE